MSKHPGYTRFIKQVLSKLDLSMNVINTLPLEHRSFFYDWVGTANDPIHVSDHVIHFCCFKTKIV